jgi:hypothetical protein
MDHEEALKTKAAERYLLDEMTPELRESFEEHAFDCTECALDLRAGAAFIQVAKAELPSLVKSTPSQLKSEGAKPRKSFRFDWFRPTFVVPAFAVLLLIIGFQNLSVIPGLRSAAREPRILPTIAFHAGTRGDEVTSVQADRKQGVVLSIQIPQTYSSYTFTLFDPQGKQQWNTSMNAAAVESTAGTVSLFIPGQSLQSGSFKLVISGSSKNGVPVEMERRTLDVQLNN